MKVKRFLSQLLCLCMVLTLLPMISIPASAKGGSGMMLGTKGIIGYSSTSGYNSIYFGQYDTTDDSTNNPTPIKWRVLTDTNGNGGTYKDKSGNPVNSANAMFLLSEYTLDSTVQFDKDEKANAGQTSPNEWEGSDAQDWCKTTFLKNASIFSSTESDAMFITSKTDTGDGIVQTGPSSLIEEKAFFLSSQEVYSSGYINTMAERLAYTASDKSSPASWWLRSPNSDYANYAQRAEINGASSGLQVSNYISARPAFNLNKNAVLFPSAATETASGGKASGTAGADALAKVSTTKPNEWKLTLLDSTRNNFGAEIMGVSSNAISFGYSDAKTGTNEYISAVIVDDLGYILYYGRIKNVTKSFGSATINIPTGVTLGNNATLKVFNEQYNGDYKTDYASALKSLAEHKVTYSLTNLIGSDTNYVADGENFIDTLVADTGYTLPSSIAVTVGGIAATPVGDNPKDADTTGKYYYNSASGEFLVAMVNGPVVITAEGVSAISTSPANLNFGSLTEGYATSPEAQTVTIKNNGIDAITGYSITGGGTDYNVTYTSASISAGGTSTFAVKPATGLSAGAHAKTLTIKTTEGSTATVNLNFTVQAKPSGGGSYTPSAPITEIINGGTTSAANLGQLISGGKTLTVDGDKGAKLVFSTEALKGIAGQTSGDIKVEMKDVSSMHQESLPGKQVFSLSVSSGSSTITNFVGAVTVTLPYTLKDGESAVEVSVWYLASDGTMIEIPCAYDPVTKTVTFKVTHFSLYVVGVDTPWVNPFTDVRDSDWFYGAVEFVSRNGMMQGIGGTDFSPNTTVTRGMLVTILWRLEKEPATTKTISFADVSDSKWYAKAVTWAAANGIASGIGDNQFAPENSLTREQLAVMLCNYEKYKGLNVSVGENTNILSYNDATSISEYAYSALQWACGSGIIKGDRSGNLNPQGFATRAEVAAMLERFIKSAAPN